MIILRVTVMGLALLFSAQVIAFDTVNNYPTTLRPSSRHCEGCHDGVIASAAGRLHSVEIDYRLAQLRSRGKLRDVSQLDPAIQLDDGRVSCLSCHSYTSQLKAKLVTSNEGSRLCVACHNP